MIDKDMDGYTVMMAAAKGGSVEAMKFALENGGSMAGKTRDGYTVMMYAAQGGSVEAMKLVLAYGGSLKGVLRYCSTQETAEFCQCSGGD